MERAVDAMVLVYALLEGHPASATCEQLLREHTGWFTSGLTLLEVKAVLIKVYGVAPAQTTQKLIQVASGPLVVLPVEAATIVAAMATADALQLDLTDAVLLETALAQRAKHLVTDDAGLAATSRQFGLTCEEPFDPALRQAVAAWETTHLPAKGLPRVLHQVHRWLTQKDARLADVFHSQTGGNSHLP
jgi:predicted nucleic acid-binding protein